MHGFYEFENSASYFLIDTTLSEDKKLDIYLMIKPPADQKNYTPFLLGDVIIYPNYALNETISDTTAIDTIQSGFWSMIQRTKEK